MPITRLPARISAAVLGAVAAVALAAPAAAQEAGGDEVGSGVASFGISDWLNLGVRLALVVAVIWGAVHGMRWYVRRMNSGGGRGGIRALEVLETHALGPNRSLHLVRLGDRAVLVGATQERITQLLTVDDPEEFKRLTDVPEDEERLATPRAAGVLSLLGSLRTGLMAMRQRQAEMNARIKAQRESQRESQREARREMPGEARESRRARRAAVPAAPAATEAPATNATAEPRFGALKGMLSRTRAAAPAPRSSDQIIAEAEEERASLFDRALASIDALEVMPNGSTAAGARARASYGAARTAPRRASGAVQRETQRDAQIAELQRAIAAARKTAS